ncbi:hypothetical protein AVEN_226440-1 [Araneus ventricosus]|uniref:Uncharacterized protein n=1 Tax=Araneus ventricosus TaxID=182803 RepID=A0A4Y2HRU9_ARAVE|nr:hypothetical protein AVEN_226440-1 [Araneus ventricosus]
MRSVTNRKMRTIQENKNKLVYIGLNYLEKDMDKLYLDQNNSQKKLRLKGKHKHKHPAAVLKVSGHFTADRNTQILFEHVMNNRVKPFLSTF